MRPLSLTPNLTTQLTVTRCRGYGNVADEIGASNAANPNFRPTIYDPLLPVGKRFSSNFPLSKIERLYHSSACDDFSFPASEVADLRLGTER